MICTVDGLTVILPMNYKPVIVHQVKEDPYLFATSNTSSEDEQSIPEKDLEDQEQREHLTLFRWYKLIPKINEGNPFEKQINY